MGKYKDKAAALLLAFALGAVNFASTNATSAPFSGSLANGDLVLNDMASQVDNYSENHIRAPRRVTLKSIAQNLLMATMAFVAVFLISKCYETLMHSDGIAGGMEARRLSRKRKNTNSACDEDGNPSTSSGTATRSKKTLKTSDQLTKEEILSELSKLPETASTEEVVELLTRFERVEAVQATPVERAALRQRRRREARVAQAATSEPATSSAPSQSTPETSSASTPETPPASEEEYLCDECISKNEAHQKELEEARRQKLEGERKDRESHQVLEERIEATTSQTVEETRAKSARLQTIKKVLRKASDDASKPVDYDKLLDQLVEDLYRDSAQTPDSSVSLLPKDKIIESLDHGADKSGDICVECMRDDLEDYKALQQMLHRSEALRKEQKELAEHAENLLIRIEKRREQRAELLRQAMERRKGMDDLVIKGKMELTAAQSKTKGQEAEVQKEEGALAVTENALRELLVVIEGHERERAAAEATEQELQKSEREAMERELQQRIEKRRAERILRERAEQKQEEEAKEKVETKMAQQREVVRRAKELLEFLKKEQQKKEEEQQLLEQEHSSEKSCIKCGKGIGQAEDVSTVTALRSAPPRDETERRSVLSSIWGWIKGGEKSKEAPEEKDKKDE